MTTLKFLLGLFTISILAFSSTASASEYEIGQVWSYKTRPGEERSRVVIVAMTPMPNSETAFGIFIEQVKIKNPHIAGGIQDHLPHAPISKEALDKSLVKLIETRSTLPKYQEGFSEWKSAFDKGKAGVFSVSVAEIISLIEQTVSK